MEKFKLRQDGAEEEFTAESLEAARDYADHWLCEGWNECEGPFWIDGWLTWVDEDGGDCEEKITVQVDPPEPRCVADAHDWRGEYDVVGGLKENPGVFGNEGGVEILRVCIHCNILRVVNTWAQRPDTGQQGFTTTIYRDPSDRHRVA